MSSSSSCCGLLTQQKFIKDNYQAKAYGGVTLEKLRKAILVRRIGLYRVAGGEIMIAKATPAIAFQRLASLRFLC